MHATLAFAAKPALLAAKASAECALVLGKPSEGNMEAQGKWLLCVVHVRDGSLTDEIPFAGPDWEAVRKLAAEEASFQKSMRRSAWVSEHRQHAEVTA